MQAYAAGLEVGKMTPARQHVFHTIKPAQVCSSADRRTRSSRISQPPGKRGCAPRVPAPGHRRRVLQPQRLQAAPRWVVRFGQLLGLQARQGGHELYCCGWRAESAHSPRQACQERLQLRMDEGSGYWRECEPERLDCMERHSKHCDRNAGQHKVSNNNPCEIKDGLCE